MVSPSLSPEALCRISSSESSLDLGAPEDAGARHGRVAPESIPAGTIPGNDKNTDVELSALTPRSPDVSSSVTSTDAANNGTTQPPTPAAQHGEDGGPPTSYSLEALKEGPRANENGEDLVIPDGGIRAWLVVFGGFINYATAFGVMNSFGTFQAHYTSKFAAYSTSSITWIGSIQLFLLFVGGVFVGPAFDRWGARRLMTAGSLLCLFSYVGNSFANVYFQYLLSQGFLFGISNALLYYPTASSISEWFDKKRGFALGLAASGSSAGAVVWPIIINYLLNDLGDAWTNRILCFISLPLLALSCYLVVERKGNAGHDTHGRNTRVPTPSVWKTLSELRFLALSVALCFIFCGMLIPFYYIPVHAENYGIDENMANNILSIAYGGSVIGRVAAGWVADRIGRFNMLILMGILMSIIVFCWVAMTSLAAQIVFAILFGLFSGGLIPLGSACVAQTTPNMGHIGLRMGSMMAICSIGGLIGGPISGGLKETNGGWASVFCFAAGMTLAGSLMLAAVRFRWEPRLRAVF